MRRPRPLVAGGVATVVLGSSLFTVGLVRGQAHESAAPGATTVAADLGPAPLAEPDDPGQAGSRALQGVQTTTPAAAPEPTGVVSPSGHRSAPTLEVPAIGLDLPVQAGGVSASGRVVPPAGRAIWVRGFGRVAPGDVGTAVLAGHVVSYGRDDVFTELRSMRVGHEVRITADGVTRIFVVRRTAVVTKAALTHDADVWGANTSTRRIVLITCDDDLGYRPDGHRVANYVVVADEVPAQPPPGGAAPTAQ